MADYMYLVNKESKFYMEWCRYKGDYTTDNPLVAAKFFHHCIALNGAGGTTFKLISESELYGDDTPYYEREYKDYDLFVPRIEEEKIT